MVPSRINWLWLFDNVCAIFQSNLMFLSILTVNFKKSRKLRGSELCFQNYLVGLTINHLALIYGMKAKGCMWSALVQLERWDPSSHIWSSRQSGFLLGFCFNATLVEAAKAFVCVLESPFPSTFIYPLLLCHPHGIFLYLQESSRPETAASWLKINKSLRGKVPRGSWFCDRQFFWGSLNIQLFSGHLRNRNYRT